MSGSAQPPTLQDIAVHAGLSRSSVSLALRNHPSIPPATRERIRQAAEALGYRPNPLVAALMAQMRGQRRTQRECIALIARARIRPQTPGPAAFIQKSPYHRILHQSLIEHADAHGFEIDEFFYDETGPQADARLSRILVARGIHGALLFPSLNDRREDYINLDWADFAVVRIGFHSHGLRLHQVVADYTDDTDVALQHATAAGETRLGLAVPGNLDLVTHHSWTSRFLLYQSTLPARSRVPLFRPPASEFNQKAFLKWFERTRPGAILLSATQPRDWLLSAGWSIPRDVRLISLTKREEPDLAGVASHTAEVGRAALELLASLLQTNQRGVPDFPRTIAVKGRWSPGPSLPET